MKIESSEISVIIQGPVVHRSYQYGEQSITQAAINSVRSLLPEAEIILSTWEGENVNSVLVDILVETPDPGAQRAKTDSIPNNVNRQILSTVNGLKRASRRYCLKLRTDIVLNSSEFLNHFINDTEARSEHSLFQHKIITNNLTSRNPTRYFQAKPFFNWKLLFHISDHVQFGFKSDLLLLWDIPTQTKNDADYFEGKIHPERFRLNETSRLAPEQYIAINCLKKKFDIDFTDYADWSEEKEAQSESLLRSNFLFLEDSKFSIAFPKYHTKHETRFEAIRYNSRDGSTVSNSSRTTSKKAPFPIELVSIVIPVHNSWPYFSDCIDSILSQSYSKLEVILVNDHTTQPELLSYLSMLQSTEPRVRVIDSAIKGANSARKLGIEAVTGDYVLVMDSDDLLDPESIQLLVSSAEKYNSDVVIFGFDVFDTITEKTLHTYTPHIDKCLTHYRSDCAANITDIASRFNHTFWVHFFKRGKLDTDCLALDLKYYEELPAIASLYSEDNIFSFVCAPLYKYRTGQPGQLTSAWKDVDRERKLRDLTAAIEVSISLTPPHSAAQKFVRQKAFYLIAAEIGNSESTDRFSQTASYELIQKAATSALGASKVWLWRTQKKHFIYLLALASLNRKNFASALTLYYRLRGSIIHMALGVMTLIGLR